MVKKLNNKGLTVVEIIVCFALASVIIISMFNVVNNYRSKQDIESYKLDIKTYKNTVTKAIYDDIILNSGIKEVNIEYTGTDDYEFTKNITLTYANEKTATIKIYNHTRCYIKKSNAEKKDDQKCPDDVVNSVDPEGYKHDSEYVDAKHSKYYIEFNDSDTTNSPEKFELPKIFFLRYNDVGAEETNGIIKIHVGLTHPDLGNNYDALNIITPNVSSYQQVVY